MRRPPEELIPGALEKYTHDLTALARQGRFAPLQRREKVVERVFQILARRLKNNPMLLGELGGDRFPIVAEVTRRISVGDVPDEIIFRQVIALDLEALIVGTTYRGDFEKLLKSVFAQIKQSERKILLFVDDFHKLAGAGAAEKCVDAANVLIPVLARKEIPIIGTSTLDAYSRYVERNQSLQRWLQEVFVSERSE